MSGSNSIFRNAKASREKKKKIRREKYRNLILRREIAKIGIVESNKTIPIICKAK
jgi:hypothetical protein